MKTWILFYIYLQEQMIINYWLFIIHHYISLYLYMYVSKDCEIQTQHKPLHHLTGRSCTRDCSSPARGLEGAPPARSCCTASHWSPRRGYRRSATSSLRPVSSRSPWIHCKQSIQHLHLCTDRERKSVICVLEYKLTLYRIPNMCYRWRARCCLWGLQPP